MAGRRNARRGDATDSRPAGFEVGADVNRSLVLALTLCFGMAMVAATDPRAHGLALWTAGLALAAVLIGVRFRSAATVAVLLTVLTLAISAPPLMLSAVSGLC